MIELNEMVEVDAKRKNRELEEHRQRFAGWGA